MNQILKSGLVWGYRGLTLELSQTKLRWKAYNEKNELVANGYSLNGKKLDKKDVENKIIETLHIKTYLPVIS